jgi:hypothetical protein
MPNARSIGVILFSRLHPFCCFSRAIATETSEYRLNRTTWSMLSVA